MHYPDFIEDAKFIQMDQSVAENTQLKAMLNNLTRIHFLCSKEFDSFDGLIHEYLVSGIEIFGLETGIVSEIKDGNEYTVRDVVSPLDVLEKNMVFPLNDTYCSHVYKANKVIGLPHVGRIDFMQSHPVYQNLKLEAYLSAPIHVDGNLFGTLNFTSTHARKQGFSEHEHTLILLMANAIGAYVSLREKEKALLDLNEKMKKFVGYVAHDLRNPIGSILSITELADRDGLDLPRLRKLTQKIAPAAEEALELVTTILDNAAVGTGKFELNLSSVKLEELCNKSMESIEELALHSKHTVTCHYPDNAAIVVDSKRIQQVLSNLLINAIKFSAPNSEITFQVSRINKATVFSIRNTIDSNQANSDSYTQTAQTAGSIGFGLEIVNEILAAHKAKLINSDNGSEFEAQFTILDK